MSGRAEEFRVDRESWPDGLPRTLSFPEGRRPLHEYVRQHASEQPAVTFYGRTLSWGTFNGYVDAFAAALTAAGYGPGEVCALFLQNSPQFLVAYFGAQRAGLAVTPVHPQAKVPAVGRQLADSDAAVLVSHTGLADVAWPAAADADVSQLVLTAYGEFTGEDPVVPVHPDVADEPSVEDTLGGGSGVEQAFQDLLSAGADADMSPSEPSVSDRP